MLDALSLDGHKEPKSLHRTLLWTEQVQSQLKEFLFLFRFMFMSLSLTRY